MIMRKPNLLAISTLFVFCSICSGASVQSGESTALFDKVWQTTRDNFYDKSMNGIDWSGMAEKYRNQTVAANSKSGFKTVINHMLSELHASHTAFYDDDDLEFYLLKSLFSNDTEAMQIEHIGVTGNYQGEEFIVKAILNGGPADLAGIKVGDRIVDVDGKKFTTAGSFRGRADTTVKLTLERPGAGRSVISVQPVKQNPQQAFLEASRKSARIFDKGGRKIGYFHLWTMTNDKFKDAMETALTGRLANTDGLVLDLRDGFGGHPFRFTDVLFRPDIDWKQNQRGRVVTYRTGYGKPIIVLINEGTRSAKESFAFQIKKTNRGLLLGATTAGAFLGAGGFPISVDSYLELPIVDLSLDGVRLEGVGVSPDIPVSAEDTYGPNDKQLTKALEVLTEKLNGAKGIKVP